MERYFLVASLALALVTAAGCSSHAAFDRVSGFVPFKSGATASRGKIEHVVIIVQENRSFDNLFAKFPGADGARFGTMHDGTRIKLRKVGLTLKTDLCHEYHCFRTEWDSGKMDGFDIAWYAYPDAPPMGKYAYQYVDPAQIQPYWTMAKQFVLGDHMFQTQGSSSFTSHQDLIAGDTALDDFESVIDVPLSAAPWGCDSVPGATSPVLTRKGDYRMNGPFPCYTYASLADRLDAAGLSWKYYTPPVGQGGGIWNAFDAIKAVRYGPDWKNDVSSPETNVFTDIAHGALPAVSWVIPDFENSDHPGSHHARGPSWVASVVNAIGESRYWQSTAIVIVWDDWGGLYDHVPPPQISYTSLGFRVPLIVVSPYARKSYVSHTQYEFASVLKFVEENWGLPTLRRADVRANSIADCFNFNQPPRKFRTIPAPHSAAYFLRQKPSGIPPDSE